MHCSLIFLSFIINNWKPVYKILNTFEILIFNAAILMLHFIRNKQ